VIFFLERFSIAKQRHVVSHISGGYSTKDGHSKSGPSKHKINVFLCTTTKYIQIINKPIFFCFGFFNVFVLYAKQQQKKIVILFIFLFGL
jgi:hypothetical protein